MAPRRLVRFDDEYRTRWGDLLAGIDEVGRGPLAGPVVAACVALRSGTKIRGIADSKTLTARERDEASVRIRDTAVAVGVGIASVAEVDAFNIRMATLLAMRRSLEALGIQPQGLLVDGRDLIGVDITCEAVVDGDAKSQAVAAASIVAKVARDALMDEDDARFPLYGFSQNKGYGTPEHLEALRLHGPCSIHRRSFRPVRERLFVQETFEGF
ncbi:MAG: ribonuclease HII [Candidatus Eiseniibacteriota bacterium]